jgi:hypothetical protein
MGAVRTTFAMVAASIVRRQQLLAQGMDDPYPLKTLALPAKSLSPVSGVPGISTVGDSTRRDLQAFIDDARLVDSQQIK